MGRGRHWKDEDITVLRELYPYYDTPTVAAALRRSPRAVKDMASQLSIKKVVTMRGKAPSNKRYYFRKGHIPPSTLHDGAVTVRRTYGVPRKMIRLSLGVWEPLAHYVYKKHFGPIPEGHVILFRDGDSMNCDPSNLVCVPKRVHILTSTNGFTIDQALAKDACNILNTLIKEKTYG